jgi:hypothetical protein
MARAFIIRGGWHSMTVRVGSADGMSDIGANAKPIHGLLRELATHPR